MSVSGRLMGEGKETCRETCDEIPAQTFMVYQLMFAIITPGLIAGAGKQMKIKFGRGMGSES